MVTSTSAPVLDETGHAAAAPLTRRSWLTLVASGVVLWLGLSAIGITLWRGLATSAIVQGDVRVSRWLVPRPTSPLDPLTHAGTLLAETITAIARTVVLVVVFRLWLHRWRE